ncbi:hypothetical protein [Kosakonia radicincitans]|uniref:hypothetical protein n=1 Tax=Kosakonia radicincitans TaxID=283686 RepID=UPI0031D4183D
MHNLQLEGAASLALQFTKSNYLAKIQNYKVIPFNDSNSDAACIARIIEIFTLNKLRAEGENLFALTGLAIPDTGAEADEINMLLKRCIQLCRHEEEELGYRERAADKARAATKQIYTVRTVSEMKNRGSQPVSRADAEYLYQAAQSRVEEQRKRVSHFRSLPGLLVEEAKRIGKGVDKPLLHSFPASLRVPAEITSSNQNPAIASASRFIMEALDELVNAVREIIKHCTPPSDRYILNNGGLLRVAAYKEYYRVDNTLLRAMVTAENYADYFLQCHKLTGQKEKLFSF